MDLEEDFAGEAFAIEEREATDAEKLNYVYDTMRRLEPAIDAVVTHLPTLIEESGPIIEGLKNSPVLKMLGVRV